MASFYADEQFPFQVTELLRNLGHDVLTVLTINRIDFIRLHRRDNQHFGIVVCTNNRNWEQLAARVNEAVRDEESLLGKLIRVVRPSV